MSRARSEYRRTLAGFRRTTAAFPVSPVEPSEREALAELILDAYRGTIDDEGESFDDALAAADAWMAGLLPQHSFVRHEPAAARPLVAASFVVVVDRVHYIDPVLVAPDVKRRGIGRAMVETSLSSLADLGVAEVGATITDGNVASERLFGSLGFRRTGAWA